MPGLKGYRHSLPFIPIKNNLEVLLRRYKEYGISDAEHAYAKYTKHSIYASAYRLVRILSVDMRKFTGLLPPGFYPTCVIIPTPGDFNKLRVYPNLKISNCNNLSTISPLQSANTLDNLVNEIDSSMQNLIKKAAWSNFARARKRLKKFEDMDTVRVLMGYFKPCGYSEEQVKAAADQITIARKPVELVFAKTPEEILKMYGSGPSSCMLGNGGGKWDWLIKAGSHPCAFFSYHPYIRGVYILDVRKVVRARTFLYTLETANKDGTTTSKEHYGRVYGATDRDQTTLKTGLEQIGITSIPVNGAGSAKYGEGYYYRAAEFNIPGVKYPSNGHYYMPLPYLDNLRGSPTVTFNDKDKSFHVVMHDFKAGVNSNVPGWDTYTAGIISQEGLKTAIPCCVCGTAVNLGQKPGAYADPNGNRYCGYPCLNTSPYVMAVDGEGTNRLVPKIDAVVDSRYEGANGGRYPLYHSNEKAAISRGAVPYVDDITALNEELCLTVAPTHKSTNIHPNFDGAYIGFRDNEEYEKYSKRTLVGIKSGTAIEAKKLDIDFDDIPGFIIKSGEIPDQILFDEDEGAVKEPVDDRQITYFGTPEEAKVFHQHLTGKRPGITDIFVKWTGNRNDHANRRITYYIVYEPESWGWKYSGDEYIGHTPNGKKEFANIDHENEELAA